MSGRLPNEVARQALSGGEDMKSLRPCRRMDRSAASWTGRSLHRHCRSLVGTMICSRTRSQPDEVCIPRERLEMCRLHVTAGTLSRFRCSTADTAGTGVSVFPCQILPRNPIPTQVVAPENSVRVDTKGLAAHKGLAILAWQQSPA